MKATRARVILAGCAVALLLAIALGASFGTDPVSVVTAVLDPASRDHDIVFEVRMPRVLLAASEEPGMLAPPPDWQAQASADRFRHYRAAPQPGIRGR